MNQKIRYAFIILLCPCFIFCSKNKSNPDAFKFYLQTEPHSLDPIQNRGTAANYLFNNLYRGLYSYSNNKLTPLGAKSCTWKNKLKLICELNKEAKWSNGEPVLASHYVNNFKRLFNQNAKTSKTEYLIHLKNAKKILKEELKPQELGVKALGSNKLEFLFDSADPVFLKSLCLPIFAPLYSPNNYQKNATEIITNGPYKIKKWAKGKVLELTSNPYFPHHATRPDVQIFFMESHDTAQRLLRSKELNFVWLISTDQIPMLKDKKGFFFNNISRFDYIGFSPKLKDKNFRKALALSLDYKHLAQIYHSRGRPGCSSLPDSYMKNKHCHEFNLNHALLALSKSQKPKSTRLRLGYSKMGGEDIKRGMEWAAFQWSKNLKLKIDIQPFELGTYHNGLRESPPHIFRKGISLDRASCFIALKTFKTGHRNNFIQYSNPAFDQHLEVMQKEHSEIKLKAMCSKGIQILMDDYALIPLGKMYFTQLHDGQFKGFTINELNQLDLEHLTKDTP